LFTFVGIGSNLWHPAALSFLTRRYPERKGLAIALHAMGGNLGSTVAPTAIGVALTFLVWRRVLLINFLLGLLMGVVLWRLLAKLETGRVEARGKELSLREYWTAVRTLAKNKSILLLCSLGGMRAMTSIGLFATSLLLAALVLVEAKLVFVGALAVLGFFLFSLLVYLIPTPSTRKEPLAHV
jgi:MFS transporter, FSR family, fosmidomycin resistance protein